MVRLVNDELSEVAYFVEEKDFRVTEESAGNGDTLALAAGEESALCADESGETVRKGHLHVVSG